jgi:hypothetical protein
MVKTLLLVCTYGIYGVLAFGCLGSAFGFIYSDTFLHCISLVGFLWLIRRTLAVYGTQAPEEVRETVTTEGDASESPRTGTDARA